MGEGTVPGHGPPVCSGVPGQLPRIVAFPSLPEPQGERGELPSEGHPGELGAHPAGEHRVIELLQRAGPRARGRGGAFEHILQDAVVIAVEAAVIGGRRRRTGWPRTIV